MALLIEDDKAILTDFADNDEVFQFSEKEYKSICKKHGITWHNYHIECPYNNIDDIEKYKNCLIELAEYNWEKKGY